MPQSLPDNINQTLMQRLNPAYLRLDATMKVTQTSSNLSEYGFADITEGVDATEHIDFLVGVDPAQALSLPVVASPNGHPVCIELLPEQGDLNVIIADAREQFDLQQKLQQKANENQLLLEKQRTLLGELHAAKAELARRNTELEEASRLQSSFLSGVSHEFRTPLTSILGHNDLLRKSLAAETRPKSDKKQIYTDAVRRASQHLLSLVENLLDHGKLDAGEITINPRPVQLSTLQNDLEMLLRPLADAKQIDLLMQRQYPVDESVYIDESRVRQCLINLAGNAIKFTDKGSVTISMAHKDDELQLRILDTGIGIKKEDLAKIRQPFWQVADTGKAGTGLGLSITERIIELMGGEMTIQSEYGRGTEVSFSLNAPATDASINLDQAREAAFKDQVSILLTEDDLDIAQLVVILLEEANAKVTHVENGELALQALQRDSFDLVLMDLNMPIMGGYETIRRMRDDGNHTPVVIMTASALEADMHKAQALGCDGYLLKPVEVADIVAIADQIIVPLE
ncbi:MAG: response regulator [Gammaproteobacteria bacterium]|nr:response regulator [Gammaproteobacteria bacterium]